MTTRSYEEAVREARGSEESLVLVEREGSRAVVTMNDPEKLNPLSATLTVQLREALEELSADHGVRAIVLTGADPAFSAGGDLRLMRDTAHPMVDEGAEGAAAVWRWIRNEFGGIAKLIARSDKAFVAAINGAAAGVGLAFALTCDLILASERARLVPAFGRIGLVPEVGTSWTRPVGSATSARSSCSPAAATCPAPRPPTSGSPTRWSTTTACSPRRSSGAGGSSNSRPTCSR